LTRRQALCLAGVLAACGAPPPPPPTLSLAVAAGSDQNPDPQGRASPVAVHLYQLSDSSRFEQADVFALLEHEHETLGPDLLGSEMLLLAPGEKKTVEHPLKVGTHVLGVAVAFRDIDRASWRAFAPVAANGPSVLTLTIEQVSAKLESPKPS